MFHSIVLASGEQEVKQAIRELQSAGCGMDQIQIIAHESMEAERMFRPKYTSRIGFVADAMAYSMAPVHKCGGYALREKLASLGLSPSAVQHYEHELTKGHLLVAVEVKELHDSALPVG